MNIGSVNKFLSALASLHVPFAAPKEMEDWQDYNRIREVLLFVASFQIPWGSPHRKKRSISNSQWELSVYQCTMI